MKRLTILIFAIFAIGCSDSGGGGGGGASKSPFAKDQPKGCKVITLASGTYMQYCTRKRDKDLHPFSFIYFLHGAEGDASNIYSGDFDALYEQFKNPNFVVVGLSFGKTETIPVEVGTASPASIRNLITQAMPQIEAEAGLSPGSVPNRNLIGFSLGGFNALNFAAYAPNVFTSVAALCPALINFNPFVDQEVADYLQRNAPVAVPDLVKSTIGLVRQKYGNVNNWTLSNPIAQVKDGKLGATPVFISTGQADEYGFYEGAEAFVRAAGAVPANSTTWMPVAGGHCSYDSVALLDFINRNR